MTAAQSAVLVAGLSGQVGQGFAEAALSDTLDGTGRFDLRAVVRRRLRTNLGGLSAAGDRITQLVGDVTTPSWALNDAALEQLSDIRAIVNLAGIVDWTASQAEMDRINYLGAVTGYELARTLSERLGRAVPYLYASTAYVAGTLGGRIPEQQHAPHPDRTPYELSKWFAERHLLRAASKTGHPVLIARIGGVIGSAATRSTTRFSSLYQLVAPLSRGQLPLLPVQSGARVDILPRDVVGEGLVRLLSRGAATDFRDWRGGVLVHLCAGEYAPTLAALLALLDSKDVEHRYRPPRLVTVSPRALRLGENLTLKYARWNRELGNRLYGLRYVSMDRVFERIRLVEHTGGWAPEVDADTVLDVAFGLDYARPTDDFAGLPMGRFV
ncbi:SDR family oxidoreductase [Nocardia terpenica]|uniref:SDR family oxidoreductase n=1 Tax=Nocardia terpenica TaxID=455432 RepID=UPI0018942F95|nr:SDR family oxidoreductase [Nocardia terpenica]MBF6062110.1 SDR family oxidoreductase [Nocardia terpenica]MBF6104198.1 SDR family oxidoreductase [Nocardia terpenica]MBF6109946.1 SDR family oxidoreductase [Nocardia terpenica]MBF6120252.1 SDR family oxidoreductase [Nocardia terpenica]MBF6152663.1 SDR family oxidoreductase [Nocardia terpenica]